MMKMRRQRESRLACIKGKTSLYVGSRRSRKLEKVIAKQTKGEGEKRDDFDKDGK